MNLPYRSIQKAISFCEQFLDEGAGVWHDEKGSYEILRGYDILGPFLDSMNFQNIFIADFLTTAIVPCDLMKKKSNTSSKVLSVGSFDTHNQAKLFCQMRDLELTTVPLPLANDSFGTNRVGKEKGPSIDGKFPDRTVFDVHLIGKLPFSTNISGVGEFIGLYVSVIDYHLVRSEPPPENLLKFILNLARNLWIGFDQKAGAFIMHLTTALLFKVLIMRVSTDYRIGCGADHLFAGFLEKRFGMLHGKAVYIGTLLSLLFFPEWEEYGLSFFELESRGMETGVISPEDLDMATNIDAFELAMNALPVRTGRPTLLSELTSDKKRIDSVNLRLTRYRIEKKWPTFN